MTDIDLKESHKWPQGWNLNGPTKHNVFIFVWNKEKVGSPIMLEKIHELTNVNRWLFNDAYIYIYI